MKGLNVLKKLLVLCNLLFVSVVFADELGNILSDNKELLFDYQFQSNELESDQLSRSWVNPVVFQYRQNHSTQFIDRTTKTGNFSVTVDQPIFRSGGIYYGIKYSQALRAANLTEIKLQRRQMIGDAVSILFNLKKTKIWFSGFPPTIKNLRFQTITKS